MLSLLVLCLLAAPPKDRLYLDPIGMDVPSTRLDYPIVYVRAPRRSADGRSRWAEVGDPRTMEPGADLVLLHPDGKEEVLVPVEPHESIADPYVSFDGRSVYFAKFHDALKHKGSDLYKVHVPTKKVTRLTRQEFTPNAAAKGPPAWGVFNLGPCPLPGGRLAFVSDRNGFKAANPGYAPNALALQLFVMDEAGTNVECIGHLNLGMALHPVILKDGRILFSSLESQGLRSHHLWGVWSIHPDGTNWGPVVSAFEIGNGTADSTHFQTQLSDESLVVESYYNLNNFGFGTYYKLPPRAPDGAAPFGPAYKADARNARLRHGRHADGRPIHVQYPFSPAGIEALTPFVLKGDWPSEPSVRGKNDSPRVGKFTHPAGAPGGDVLTAYSAGSLNSSTRHSPAVDSGIYVIPGGKPIDEPARMRLVKNDPKYHEQWPRALVPYERIYGVKEPRTLPRLANDGKASRHLPAGTPFGLVGSSSLYKRESYPYGVVRPGSVTATSAGDKDQAGHNWVVQGADAGLYANADVHAVRILLLEPTTEAKGGRTFYNHGRERMRLLGEVPVRKFRGGEQPTDPDGNPDTSFLVKVPADVAWTFQTLDRDGMVLNAAQTWHQLRPGEVRTDCGGCHAHSQKPTDFAKTAAAKEEYQAWDLTTRTPLLTAKNADESGRRWDKEDASGVRYAEGVQTVEYHRDVRPILERSCVACHSGADPAAKLDLADEKAVSAQNPAGLSFGLSLPGTYARLAADAQGKFGHKPLHRHGWTDLSASRYVRMMQSRRSLLAWKVHGRRLDGWTNDDFPYEATPGDPATLTHKGERLADTPRNRERAQVAFTGGAMPPPAAVASGKVKALTDEDRRTIVRWIDLGCPIDLARGGWAHDDSRPTLALSVSGTRLLVGVHDCGTGLDRDSLRVVAAGEDVTAKLTRSAEGVWEARLTTPATVTASVRDRAGNVTRVVRTFASKARP